MRISAWVMPNGVSMVGSKSHTLLDEVVASVFVGDGFKPRACGLELYSLSCE